MHSNSRGSISNAKKLLLATGFFIAQTSFAQMPTEGYLCCTVHYGVKRGTQTVSDANWKEYDKILPAGTPVKLVGRPGYATSNLRSTMRYHFELSAPTAQITLANDYSRHLSDTDFLNQFVVSQEVQQKLASYPADVQSAIKSGRVMKGMTKEQVVMALAPPLKEENPNLNADKWRYYWGSFDEFNVHWDAQGLVRDITGEPFTLADVVYSAPK